MKKTLVICMLIISGCSAKNENVIIQELSPDQPDLSVTEVVEEKIS